MWLFAKRAGLVTGKECRLLWLLGDKSDAPWWAQWLPFPLGSPPTTGLVGLRSLNEGRVNHMGTGA